MDTVTKEEVLKKLDRAKEIIAADTDPALTEADFKKISESLGEDGDIALNITIYRKVDSLLSGAKRLYAAFALALSEEPDWDNERQSVKQAWMDVAYSTMPPGPQRVFKEQFPNRDYSRAEKIMETIGVGR